LFNATPSDVVLDVSSAVAIPFLVSELANSIDNMTEDASAADAPDFDSTDEGVAPKVYGTTREKVEQAAKVAIEKILNIGVDGVGPVKGSEQLAQEYLAKHKDPERAMKRLVTSHTSATALTGLVTGLGGLVTLPVAIPADLAALWLVQGRMVGAVAVLRGYDVRSDEVRTMLLLSLLGSSVTEVFAKAGVEIGTKTAVAALNKVPGAVLVKINQAVGFRLITKAGTKGVVNLVKVAPVAGGVVGGTVNAFSTRLVAGIAKRNFPLVPEG
jgi:hypothetical protein